MEFKEPLSHCISRNFSFQSTGNPSLISFLLSSVSAAFCYCVSRLPVQQPTGKILSKLPFPLLALHTVVCAFRTFLMIDYLPG